MMAESTFALLIIDMQQAFFEAPDLRSRQDRLVEHCNELISSAADHGVPIVNVRTQHERDKSTWTLNMLEDDRGFLFPHDPGTAVVSGLHMDPSLEVLKTRDSAFFRTELESELLDLGIVEVVLCGVSTHSCIASTASDAYAANFRVTLAKEAIATDNPEFHDAALDLLTKEFRQKVLANSEINSVWRESGR